VFQDTQGANYGFLKDGDTYTIINVPNVPGAVFTEPRGINDNGQIVGWFSDAGVLRGFLKDGAMFTTFDVPGPGGVNTGTKMTLPHSINNAGQIVGWFRDASGVDHGFLKEGETFTQIDPPNAIFTRAHGINDDGQIVGWYRHTELRDHGFLDNDGTFTTFDAPNAMLTVPYSINNTGQNVGYFQGPIGDQGFLKSGDTYSIIAVPGGTDTKPYGINNAGQIVGTFLGTATYQGFVATPTAVDMTPPLITVAASPSTLAPPNGKRVAVTVTGKITDSGGSGVQAGSAAYVVMDEYGQLQPSGSLTLEADGSYAFTVALEASRRGNDQDGRHYTIAVSAKDNIGNPGFKSATVTVPHG
jgi:probable HAF family extracellular repeat protein